MNSCGVGGDDDEVEKDRGGRDGDGDSIACDGGDGGHGALDGGNLGGIVVGDHAGSLDLDAHLVLLLTGDLSDGRGGRRRRC